MNIKYQIMLGICAWSLFGTTPEHPATIRNWISSNMAHAESDDNKHKDNHHNKERDDQKKDMGEDWKDKEDFDKKTEDRPKFTVPYPKSIKGFFGKVSGKVIKVLNRNLGTFSFKVSGVEETWSGNKSKFPQDLKNRIIRVASRRDKKRNGRPPLKDHLLFVSSLKTDTWLSIPILHASHDGFILQRLSYDQIRRAKKRIAKGLPEAPDRREKKIENEDKDRDRNREHNREQDRPKAINQMPEPKNSDNPRDEAFKNEADNDDENKKEERRPKTNFND